MPTKGRTWHPTLQGSGRVLSSKANSISQKPGMDHATFSDKLRGEKPARLEAGDYKCLEANPLPSPRKTRKKRINGSINDNTIFEVDEISRLLGVNEGICSH